MSPANTLELKVLDHSADWVQALVMAHRDVFGSQVDEHWVKWKYGRGVGVGLYSGNQLAAYCGGVPRGVWWYGRPLKGLQIMDVMVREYWRQSGRRGGAFARVCAALYAQALGAGQAPSTLSHTSAPFDVGYGFPNHRHTQLGQMLGLGRDTAGVTAAVWTRSAQPVMQQVMNDDGSRGEAWVAEPLRGSEVVQAVVRGWEQMRPALRHAIVCDRGWDDLRWRHLEQPAPHQGGQAPDSVRWIGLRRPWHRLHSGVVVVRLPRLAQSAPVNPAPGPGTKAMWLDWIGPPQMLRLAWAHALEASLVSGAAEMHGWFTEAPWKLLSTTAPAASTEAARIGVPLAGEFNWEALAGLSWWMMAGDTDFL